jgi:hypothetical protein
MLLIAIPKSASTSLATTIAKISGLHCGLGIPATKIDINCEGYEEIQKYHCNMVERSPLFLQQIIKGRKKIFKEHLLPTDRHLKILNKFKERIVILLRDKNDVYDAYRRIDIEHYKKEKKYINLKQIKEDINNFHDRYMWWASNKPNVIVFYYRDLITNYQAVMNRILKWYKLKRCKIIPLMKLKYTGIGEKRIKECY